ncbi:MAG: hypothetical protein GF334_07810 [Candidatus Altiarchaeales archaeon]|nr:hypothetical protein [Candidatus Altiarchaeales archaeon]
MKRKHPEKTRDPQSLPEIIGLKETPRHKRQLEDVAAAAQLHDLPVTELTEGQDQNTRAYVELVLTQSLQMNRETHKPFTETVKVLREAKKKGRESYEKTLGYLTVQLSKYANHPDGFKENLAQIMAQAKKVR